MKQRYTEKMRPTLLIKCFLIGCCFLSAPLIPPIGLVYCGDYGLDKGNEKTTTTETHILKAVNLIRKKHRLAPLRESAPLRRMARKHSENMAKSGILGHGNGTGRDFGSRIGKITTIPWRTAGENAGRAQGYGNNADEIVAGWMASKPHRENILSGNFDLTGIGTAKAEDGTLYATQVFVGSVDSDK